MKFNLHNKSFRSIYNSVSGDVNEDTIFHYSQQDAVISGTYSGGSVEKGELHGKFITPECMVFMYQHINTQGELMTGKCKSFPETNEQGKIQLKESWQWTSGDFSKGNSILVEIEA